MSMYDSLDEKYDLMIRWKQRLEREAPFFQRLFSEKRIKRVLDLGCGTGHHSKLFQKWGCDVVAVDPSPAMLRIARGEGKDGLPLFTQKEQTTDGSGTIDFVEADFLSFPSLVDGPFDAVVALGNSLPHLANRDQLVLALSNISSILKPDGVFVFQNRNYDRLMEEKDRFQFPTTFREADSEQIFFRFNDFEEDHVRFNIVHFQRVGQRWMHSIYSTELHPWRKLELEQAASEAGFSIKHYYGDFSGTPFDAASSSDLVGLLHNSSH